MLQQDSSTFGKFAGEFHKYLTFEVVEPPEQRGVGGGDATLHLTCDRPRTTRHFYFPTFLPATYPKYATIKSISRSLN